jgi:DNA-binding response OmpR family regulator
VSSSSTVVTRSADLWRPRFRLVIADPDTTSSSELVAELGSHGIDVESCRSGGEALFAAAKKRPDAVLVAAQPGDLSSAEMVRLLSDRIGVPVLVGVGAGQGVYAGPALAAGATACVARPYLISDLVPIMRAIRPEAIAATGPMLQSGALHLDPERLEVRLHDQPVRLPLREFDLLRFFMAHVDKLVTREQIYDAVWGGSAAGASNTLTVHIKRLRARLGDDQGDPRIILTVRGLGYRFVPPP